MFGLLKSFKNKLIQTAYTCMGLGKISFNFFAAKNLRTVESRRSTSPAFAWVARYSRSSSWVELDKTCSSSSSNPRLHSEAVETDPASDNSPSSEWSDDISTSPFVKLFPGFFSGVAFVFFLLRKCFTFSSDFSNFFATAAESSIFKMLVCIEITLKSQSFSSQLKSRFILSEMRSPDSFCRVGANNLSDSSIGNGFTRFS